MSLLQLLSSAVLSRKQQRREVNKRVRSFSSKIQFRNKAGGLAGTAPRPCLLIPDKDHYYNNTLSKEADSKKPDETPRQGCREGSCSGGKALFNSQTDGKRCFGLARSEWFVSRKWRVEQSNYRNLMPGNNGLRDSEAVRANE